MSAEIARIDGRELDAERLYEQAIRSARESGFVHNEALAYELAAHFYAARGFEEIAHLYLGNARKAIFDGEPTERCSNSTAPSAAEAARPRAASIRVRLSRRSNSSIWRP